MGNFLSGSISNPLSRTTRASSPAKLLSWFSPVKNVIDFPLFLPRPVDTVNNSSDCLLSLPRQRTCPTDPMDIILNRQREGVIDHQPHTWNIQPPSRYVRSHKHSGLSRLEARQSIESTPLWHITMKASNGEFLVAKIAFYSCRLSLVEDKDENSIII